MVFAFQSAPPAHKGLPPNELIALTDVLTQIIIGVSDGIWTESQFQRVIHDKAEGL